MPTLIIPIQHNARSPSWQIKQGGKNKTNHTTHLERKKQNCLYSWCYDCKHGENTIESTESLLERRSKLNKVIW